MGITYRKPGENQATVIEEFVANSAMIKILIEDEKYLNKDLVEYLKELSGRQKLEEPSKISEILMEIKNRLFPYPVLCEENDDYVDCSFNIKTEVKEELNDIVIENLNDKNKYYMGMKCDD